MRFASGNKLSLPLLLLIPFVLATVHAKTVLLDDSDDNSHLCLSVGDTITLKLSSNPTTGYSWAKPEATSHLEMLSSRSERDSPSELDRQASRFSPSRPRNRASPPWSLTTFTVREKHASRPDVAFEDHD